MTDIKGKPKTIHKCTICKNDFVWTDESSWYGNYTIIRSGNQPVDEKENIIAKFCSLSCKKKSTCYKEDRDDG